MSDATQSKSVRRPIDLEIKDAQLIFDAVWSDLEATRGRENLRFPREIIWLGGAPGAGKGTNTPFVAKTRDITAPPLVMSSLLDSPAAQEIKNAGGMVGDREVVGLLLEALLDATYHDGVIVDGFPRTQVQVECLKMFFHAMTELHSEYRHSPVHRAFRKPLFRIALLFVSESVSVERQLKRGQNIREQNKHVRETGVGELQEERATDLDPGLCRRRYQTFKETTFEALQSLRRIFHFHFIDAEDDVATVEQNILKEFAYQSSLELSHDTLDVIRNIPIASQLARHARQELVERLEGYQEDCPALFKRVATLINEKFIPIIGSHAISGHARINTEDPLFDDALALRMVIDVFSERGYHALVDVHKMDVPERFDPETYEISCRQKRVYRIEITFPRSEIRRGH